MPPTTQPKIALLGNTKAGAFGGKRGHKRAYQRVSQIQQLQKHSLGHDSRYDEERARREANEVAHRFGREPWTNLLKP